MIRIVLADDHSMVRMGFKMILESQADFQVVGEASNSDEAFGLVHDASPDVLLTDISMGNEKSGMLLVRRIADAGLPTRCVMLTMHDEQGYLLQSLKAGAAGYLLKSSSDAELFKAVRRAAEGDSFICDDMIDGFIESALSSDGTAVEPLTPRESELVSLAVKGYSNQDIAAALSISVKTVESQKGKIMHKLGIDSKPELFEYAVRHGLVKL